MTFSVNSKIMYLSVLFFCFSMACSQNSNQAAEVNTSELPQLQLDHQFTISDSEDVMLQQVAGVKSDSEGRIYLPDQRALQIYVFDSNGSYLTSIGRDGSGPGEFQSLLRIYIDQKDQLIAFDVRLARNTVFIENNNSWETGQIYMVEGHRYSIESADSDGNVILRQSSPQQPERGAYWYEHELATGNLSSGLTERNILSFKETGFLVSDDNSMNPIPFGRTTVTAASPEGNFYMVWNEQFDLAVYNAQMEITDSLSTAIPNQPISSEERNEAIDRLGDNFRTLGREHIPETKPVISNMFIDGNKNIWLQTFDSPEYLILDSEGTPLRSFDLEDELRLVHADENRLYASGIGDQGYEIHVYEYQL